MIHESYQFRGQEEKRAMKFYILLFSAVVFMLFSLYGCGNNPPSMPAKSAQTKNSGNTAVRPMTQQPEVSVEESPAQEGYIYQQRDRRDPFVPLIVLRKSVKKGKDSKAGTLESYDLSEFRLAAIAKRGSDYFALLTTPDNRSFSVRRGDRIGLYKGKVKKITKNKVLLEEYSEDYRGKLKPREIILEFHEGEVE